MIRIAWVYACASIVPGSTFRGEGHRACSLDIFLQLVSQQKHAAFLEYKFFGGPCSETILNNYHFGQQLISRQEELLIVSLTLRFLLLIDDVLLIFVRKA